MFMPNALSKSIERIARHAVGKDWNLYAAMLEHWQEIVGAEYARVTTLVKITFPHQPSEARRGDGTLCIRLPKGLAMEFEFKTAHIRQRINAYFGYNAIGRIVFEPVYTIPEPPAKTPAAPDPAAIAQIHETALNIDDEALREALGSFGEAMLRGENRQR
jgi:hypothetical protein